MEPSRFTIRPFHPRDYPAQYEIGIEFEPRVGVSVEELRREDEVMARQPDHLRLKLVAETAEDSRVVGFGSLSQHDSTYHPQKYWVWVLVRKAFRGRGIGSALYSALEGEARARGGSTLWVPVNQAEAQGKRFADRHGFAPGRTVWVSKLDLRSADLQDHEGLAPKLEADGLRFSTWNAEGSNDPKVRHQLYDLSQLCSRDVPRIGEFHPTPFEQFEALELESTRAMPEAVFLAYAGGELVGVSSLERDQIRADTLRVGFTGVRPEYRGRKIASELKRRAAEFARDAGYRYLQTGNDSLNQPILAINRRLGFQAELTWVTCEKKLEPRR